MKTWQIEDSNRNTCRSSQEWLCLSRGRWPPHAPFRQNSLRIYPTKSIKSKNKQNQTPSLPSGKEINNNLSREREEEKQYTGRGKHVSDGLRNHGGVFVDDEFETLGANQLHRVFLPHLPLPTNPKHQDSDYLSFSDSDSYSDSLSLSAC